MGVLDAASRGLHNARVPKVLARHDLRRRHSSGGNAAALEASSSSTCPTGFQLAPPVLDGARSVGLGRFRALDEWRRVIVRARGA